MIDSDSISYSRSINSAHDEINLVCADIEKLLTENRLTRHWFAINLLANEFISNAIRHGNRNDPEKKVRVSFRANSKWLLLQVEDQGEGFDWQTIREKPLPDGAMPGGRGIHIGRLYSQKLIFNRRGNKVGIWIERQEQQFDNYKQTEE